MVSRAVVVVEIADDLAAQRGLIEDNYMIQEFAANGADQAFDVRVLTGFSSLAFGIVTQVSLLRL